MKIAAKNGRCVVVRLFRDYCCLGLKKNRLMLALASPSFLPFCLVSWCGLCVQFSLRLPFVPVFIVLINRMRWQPAVLSKENVVPGQSRTNVAEIIMRKLLWNA